MSWLDPQRYSLPVVVSVGLHILIGLLFLFQWPTEHRVPEPVPQHMIANVVQTENKAVKQREEQAAKEQRRKEQAAKREADRKKQQAAEQKKAREKAQREKQLAEQKAREKAAQEKAAKEKAAKDKAAAEQKAQQQAKERAQQEQQLLEQLAKEQAAEERRAQEQARKAAEEAARQAELAEAMTADATTAIRSKVESVWQYPPAVRPDQTVTVRIVLVPTGQVMDVKVVKSSGNAALDRSVEQAVLKASPLPVPKDPRVFEQNFRTITFNFTPENATW
ncbi:MAG: protein TolA [Oleibacter sp.]|nr:protein TolA [Thalassolituus sp.]|tara:strand:- start:617 stop:1450 length:834 start_codon:yes stop_codon:yes gene_type:complete